MDIPPLFVHPSVDTHLSCFPLEVIMNQVFMEIFTSSRDLNFRKSGSTLVVQWLGLRSQLVEAGEELIEGHDQLLDSSAG